MAASTPAPMSILMIFKVSMVTLLCVGRKPPEQDAERYGENKYDHNSENVKRFHITTPL
jgi:hypothetical protein